MMKFVSMAALAIGFAGPVLGQSMAGEMSASANGTAIWQFPDRRALNPGAVWHSRRAAQC